MRKDKEVGKSRQGKLLLDNMRKDAGLDMVAKVKKKGVSNEDIFQLMVARDVKDDEHHAAIRNIFTAVKEWKMPGLLLSHQGKLVDFRAFSRTNQVMTCLNFLPF